MMLKQRHETWQQNSKASLQIYWRDSNGKHLSAVLIYLWTRNHAWTIHRFRHKSIYLNITKDWESKQREESSSFCWKNSERNKVQLRCMSTLSALWPQDIIILNYQPYLNIHLKVLKGLTVRNTNWVLNIRPPEDYLYDTLQVIKMLSNEKNLISLMPLKGISKIKDVS